MQQLSASLDTGFFKRDRNNIAQSGLEEKIVKGAFYTKIRPRVLDVASPEHWDMRRAIDVLQPRCVSEPTNAEGKNQKAGEVTRLWWASRE